MRCISATIFLGCFLLMAFSKGITLLNFYWNQDAITAKFCVNKNKPKMHCNGKCFLAKQIKEQEKREAANAIMELSKIEVVSSRAYFSILLTPQYNTITAQESIYVNNPLYKPYHASVFKPPAC